MRADIGYPQTALLLIVCCVLAGLVVGFSSSGVTLGPYNSDWNGGSELRTQLHTDSNTVTLGLSADAYSGSDPDETVTFLIAPERHAENAERLDSFVSNGGTLVVASADNETNDLLMRLGLSTRIDGTPVRDAQTNFRSPELPRANNVTTHQYTSNVEQLTLNQGTVLERTDATVLVNTSRLAYLDANRNETLDDTELLGQRPVAAVETVGDGEVVVVSDESVFINAMLEQSGNREFARNLASDHEQVVVDYSRGEPLPPFVYAFLVTRSTPVLQLLLGVAGIGLIVAWRSGGGRLRAIVGRDQPAAGDIDPDPETIAAYLADRHPSWEHRRIQRVTKVIIRRQQQGDDND